MSQNITWLGSTYTGVEIIQLPKSGGGNAGFADPSPVTCIASDVSSGKKFLRSDGVLDTGTNSGGSGKNIQVNSDADSVRMNGYTATDITITVKKTGTYKVSWTAWRSSSSGTMGTNLHRNSSSGTNQQTWTNNYGQHIVLSNQSYTAGDVLTLYATSGSNSRYCWVSNLIIEEQ